MLLFSGDSDGDGHGVGTCKQTLKLSLVVESRVGPEANTDLEQKPVALLW